MGCADEGSAGDKRRERNDVGAKGLGEVRFRDDIYNRKNGIDNVRCMFAWNRRNDATAVSLAHFPDDAL